jgi:dihydroorotase-like cyclic amidohydrolase
VVGGDADFAIVDLEKRQKVTPAVLQSAQNFTPFEGMEITGWPVETILRGQVVFSKDRIVAHPGVGQYIKRPVGLHDERQR